MGEEEDSKIREPNFPKLNSFLHIPPPSATVDSPEHPSTPPLQTLASVPFKWEEHPGKPRPCTDDIIITVPEAPRPLILELPPCRTASLYMENSPASRSTAKSTPSPSTVLDGPYNVGRPKFSSFRFFREAQHEYLFDGCSPHDHQGLGSCKIKRGGKLAGLFGKFKGGKKVFDGGSCRFSPSSNSIDSCCACDINDDESCSTTIPKDNLAYDKKW